MGAARAVRAVTARDVARRVQADVAPADAAGGRWRMVSKEKLADMAGRLTVLRDDLWDAAEAVDAAVGEAAAAHDADRAVAAARISSDLWELASLAYRASERLERLANQVLEIRARDEAEHGGDA
jgi:hypothetical protein